MMIKMKCENVQDYLFSFDKCTKCMSSKNMLQNVIKKLRITIHLLHCEDCNEYKRIIKKATVIISDDFLPQSADNSQITDAVMKLISMQDMPIHDTVSAVSNDDPETLSMQTWAVAGLLILISLLSAYFSIDILSSQESLVFVVPLAITIGSVITAYGAIFIGTHLKELTKRFGISI